LGCALSVAWRQHCYKVMLLTGRKDEGTLRFYEQAGFDRHEKQAFVAKPVAQPVVAPDVRQPASPSVARG
jgi:hypothetical protein